MTRGSGYDKRRRQETCVEWTGDGNTMQGGDGAVRDSATTTQHGKGDTTTSQQGKREANKRRRHRRIRDGGVTREPAASTDNSLQAGGDNIYSTRGERAAEQQLLQGECGGRGGMRVVTHEFGGQPLCGGGDRATNGIGRVSIFFCGLLLACLLLLETL